MSRPRRRHAAERRGRGAETLAAWWLRLHGWRILARRARVPGGEVDIVARRGRTLAFVEVKARASDEAAGFSLDAYRLRRVVTAAERLSPRFMRSATSCASMRCSSSRGACPAIWPTSGKDNQARR